MRVSNVNSVNFILKSMWLCALGSNDRSKLY
jgi:hypothetical protein